MNSNQSVQKYITLYMKRWRILWLSSATLCAIPILMAGLKYDNLPHDILLALAPFLVAVVLILINRFIVTRFPKNIKKQEESYSICFSDDNVERIGNNVYLSNDWIICLGKCALYKQHIRKMTYEAMHSARTGTTHMVIFQTMNDESYTFWIEPKKSIDKVEQWVKQ